MRGYRGGVSWEVMGCPCNHVGSLQKRVQRFLDHDGQRPDQVKAHQLFETFELRGSFWDLGRTSCAEKFGIKPIGTANEDIAAMVAGKR